MDTKKVKTRKAHRCELCQRDIPAGSTMYNHKGMYQGDWQNWYECKFCSENLYQFVEDYISDDLYELREYIYYELKKKYGKVPSFDWEWTSFTEIEVYFDDLDTTEVLEIPY